MRRKTLVRFATVMVILLSVVGAVAVTVSYAMRLPHPSVADRDSLLRWIVLRDLSQEDPCVRRILAQRLDEEFGQQKEVNWQAASQRMKPHHKQRLAANMPLLIESWLEEKKDQYFALPSAERVAYIDQILERVGQWRHALALGGSDSNSSKIGDLLKRVDQWKQGAEPAQRRQIDQFIVALQTRWLQRMFLGSASSKPALR